MILVLDASTTLAWQFIRADRDEAQLAVQALHLVSTLTAAVPTIWFSEVANGLLRGERQGAIQTTQSDYFLQRLKQLQIQVDIGSSWQHQANALALARAYALTVYDACYLELAIRLGGELATFDQKLATAARAAGVHVFGDPQ